MRHRRNASRRALTRPMAETRLHNRWRLGDRGAIYEFNVKLSVRIAGLKASDRQMEHDTEVAVEEFTRALKKRYPWVGRVYLTGRSGGWLAVEDAKGGASELEVKLIAEDVEEAREQFENDLIESYGHKRGFPREEHSRNAGRGTRGTQQRLPGPGFVDPKLKKAYEFFRGQQAPGIVGQSAKGAMDLARAEKYADDHGWEAVWEDDPEEYELGDAETERPFEVLTCVIKDENGHVLGSLGSIGMSGNARQDRDYRRVVEAELALEAMP